MQVFFPDDWKIAKITRIHKSEENTLYSNYRPISVISVLPKVFEKVVHEQLMNTWNNSYNTK